MIFINRTMPRKNTPAPFKSSCFTETSRIAAGTLLLTEFARWHPGAPASRASGGFTAPDFLSLHSACIQVALLYFCESFANSPLALQRSGRRCSAAAARRKFAKLSRKFQAQRRCSAAALGSRALRPSLRERSRFLPPAFLTPRFSDPPL